MTLSIARKNLMQLSLNISNHEFKAKGRSRSGDVLGLFWVKGVKIPRIPFYII